MDQSLFQLSFLQFRSMTEMAQLSDRFDYSIRIFCLLLSAIGISYNNNGKLSNQFWKIFCYILSVSSGIYLFVERSYNYFGLALLIENVDAFMAVVDRFNRLFGNVLLHSLLLFQFQRIRHSFFKVLNQVDTILNQPDFKRLGTVATISVIWILLSVIRNF